jgi:pyruvate dehydrogenase E2 component (dihydrolipoamide acetyltransferase)
MTHAFLMPDLGEGIAEADVLKWFVSEGDVVTEDQPLVEVETDKAIMELPSPYAGTVLELSVREGGRVRVGEPLVLIGDPAELAAAAASANGHAAAAPLVSNGAAPAPVAASPYVRRLALSHGIDLADLMPTGPGGRLTEADVEAARKAVAPPADGRRVPLRGVRRRIADNMARSHREVPAVTVVEECDFSDLKRLHLSYLPHVIAACAGALGSYPELNASVDGDDLVMHDRVDVGVATQSDDGLLVPVVRGADKRSLDELGAEVRRLHHGALSRTLTPSELHGSTFTVSAAGRRGGFLATPLVNHPEVAILAVHRIAPRPVVRRGKVVVRRIGMVSLTFDHRVADGIGATNFLLDVIARLGAFQKAGV